MRTPPAEPKQTMATLPPEQEAEHFARIRAFEAARRPRLGTFFRGEFFDWVNRWGGDTLRGAFVFSRLAALAVVGFLLVVALGLAALGILSPLTDWIATLPLQVVVAVVGVALYYRIGQIKK